MPRVQPLEPKNAAGASAELLEKVAKKFGKAPNLLKTLAHSPAALGMYLASSDALDASSLSAALSERIALHLAELNSCDYCLAAHSAKGKMAGLSGDQIIESRRGESDDPKADALLKLARAIIETKGFVSDELIETARRAGVTDGELAEVAAVVAVNLFTNYANHLFETEVDFPRAKPLPAEVCSTM